MSALRPAVCASAWSFFSSAAARRAAIRLSRPSMAFTSGKKKKRFSSHTSTRKFTICATTVNQSISTRQPPLFAIA
jgi:hypothetical protein